jgi:hypothetical protein
MLRLILPALVVMGLTCAPSFGQPIPPPVKIKESKEKETGKKEPVAPPADLPTAIPGEVDVHFFNGSTVRMIIHSEKLEVATLYGKLSVPIRDVRAVEFGLHFPEGTGDKIQSAIKNLASNNYQEREDALKALVDLGPFSYPAVFEASKEKDAEVARRAQEVIKKLQSKFPKSDLKNSIDDRVVTSKFTIVGQILTSTIKAKTEYFGDQELPLAKMRTLRAVGGPSLETVVSVDALKFANNNTWMDSKFRLDGKTAIVISAKGVVDVNPQDGGTYLVGPNGFNASRNGRGTLALRAGQKIGQVNTSAHGGMLVGKIGEDGDPFFIGENYDGTMEAEGNLFLHIGPSPFGCPSSGAFEVKITRKGN